MSIVLRERQKTPNGKISLYLDISHKGKRWYKYLKMYLHPVPENGRLSPNLRDENKTTLALAKAIKSKYEVKLYTGEYGLTSDNNSNADFLLYFQAIADKRKSSLGNYGIGTVF